MSAFPELTDDLISKVEEVLDKADHLAVLSDKRLTTIYLACCLYRMERAEKEAG